MSIITAPTFNKNRGTFDQDTSNGSTRQHLVYDSRSQGYTDATGACGCDTYKSGSVAFSIYDNVGCTRRLVGAGSLSIQLRSDAYNLTDYQTVTGLLRSYLQSQFQEYTPDPIGAADPNP